MNGVLNINKPPGMTSHDVVGRVRRIARIKRVGHAGTLDPDATGVLLICLGPATRIAEYLADEGKSYRAVLALGVSTSTEDASGDIVAAGDASSIDREAIESVLPRFVGAITQIPPMVSAVHHQGQRLYKLARHGITVERQPRSVHIDAIRLLDFQSGVEATATLEIDCGKGTYIRTLCADIGQVLGTGGHMASLSRTRVGAFAISDAVPLDQLSETTILPYVASPSEALSNFPLHRLADAGEVEDVCHGRSITANMATTEIVRIVSEAGDLLALARADENRLHPFKVFI